MADSEKLTIAQADFHRLWGGQAEVVLALSKSLARRGHRVIVTCPPGSQLESRAAEAGLESFTGCNFKKGFKPFSFYRDVRKLRAFLEKEHVHIYHCHGSQDHWTAAFALSALAPPAGGPGTPWPPTKIVRTRHNIYPVKGHRANRWLFQKKTSQVITIFGDQGKFFTESGLLKMEDLVTLHSPLPQEFVNPAAVDPVIRRELKIPDGAPLVGYVVNAFHPDKAPLDFVAACAKVASEIPDAQFCMVGHGPLLNDVKAEIAKLPSAARFHLVGFRKDILNVMAGFNLVVLTSVTREASSTVLKQAGALGIPVVATDVGGTREVMAHGRTGLLVKAGDVTAIAAAMKEILSNRDKARSMGAAGKEKVLSEFTSDAIAEKTEAVYRRVVTENLKPQHA